MPKHAATTKPKPLEAIQGRNRHIYNRAPSPQWIDRWRSQIPVALLIKRLSDFAVDDPDNPTGPRLTRTQAMVGLSLLRKSLPDMQSLEISGNSDKPIQVQLIRFADGEVIDVPHQQVNSSVIEDNPRLIEDDPHTRDRSIKS
jgi:hypothetical protein